MPHKALFIGSSPRDTAFLRTGQELREIRNATEDRGKDIRWDSISDARLGDIFDRIRDSSPDIVHFSGHGHPNGELAFVDEANGRTQTATPEILATLFASLHAAKREIECVVFNACHSDKMAWAIAPYCDYVVAVHDEVSDQDAREFASRFYQSWIITEMPPLEAFRSSCAIIKAYSETTPYFLTGRGVSHDSSENARNDILYYFSRLIMETTRSARAFEDIMVYLQEESPSRLDVRAVDCLNVCHMQLSLQRDEERRAVAELRAAKKEVLYEFKDFISMFNNIISSASLFAVAMVDQEENRIRQRWITTELDYRVIHMQTPPYLKLTLTTPKFK